MVQGQRRFGNRASLFQTKGSILELLLQFRILLLQLFLVFFHIFSFQKRFSLHKKRIRAVCADAFQFLFRFDQLKSLKLFRVSMVVTMTLTLLTMELLAENTRAT